MRDDATGREKFIAWLEKQVAKAQEEIAEFKGGLDSDRWQIVQTFNTYGGPAIIAAARIQVLGGIHDALTDPESKATIESVRQYAKDKVITKGLHIGSSTAMLAEYCDRAILAAWIDIYKQTTQIHDHGRQLGM